MSPRSARTAVLFSVVIWAMILWFADRALAGFVQCASMGSCPW